MNTLNQKSSSYSSFEEELRGSNNMNLFDKASKMISDFANFSTILRMMGAIAVLASMSMFLMQGWGDTDDIERFRIMLLQTFLLGGAGFAMVKLLKEVKGARLFFGLALVSVAANFTTLGALIYSMFSWDNLSVAYPQFAEWKASTPGGTLLSAGIAVAVLTPLTWLSFSVLARPAAKRLTLWYVGANLLLLVPVREVTAIVIIVAVASVLLMKFFVQKNENADMKELFRWNTKEGKFARLILFVPLIIMTVRSFHYEFTNMSVLMLCVAIYALLVFCARVFANKFSPICHLTAMFAASIGVAIIAFELNVLPISNSFELPTFALLLTGVCVDLYRRAKGSWMEDVSVFTAAFILTSTFVINHLAFNTVVSFFGALLTASFMLFYAFQIRSRILGCSGLMLAASIPVFHIGEITNFFIGSGWLGFAVGGVGIIVLASLLDRYGAIVQLKLSGQNNNKLAK
jgi:hypothetical protein